MEVPRYAVKFLFLLTVAANMLCMSGCSSEPPLVSVKGKVTLDGKSYEGIEVIFEPVEINPDDTSQGYGRALTDANGNYEIKNYIGESGLFPGEYKVTFHRYVDASGKLIGPDAKSESIFGARDQMPKRYQSYDTTPERLEVPSGGITRDFKLTTK